MEDNVFNLFGQEGREIDFFEEASREGYYSKNSDSLDLKNRDYLRFYIRASSTY